MSTIFFLTNIFSPLLLDHEAAFYQEERQTLSPTLALQIGCTDPSPAM